MAINWNNILNQKFTKGVIIVILIVASVVIIFGLSTNKQIRVGPVEFNRKENITTTPQVENTVPHKSDTVISIHGPAQVGDNNTQTNTFK